MLSPPSPKRRALLTALSIATLTACAGSQDPRPRAADPVIEVRTITRTVCPAELRLPIPAEVPVPAGAIVRGNAAGMGFMAQRFSREELLGARLADAAATCAATYIAEEAN